MTQILQADDIEVLTHFYKKLSDSLIQNGLLKPESCLIRLLQVKSNVRLRIIQSSVISKYLIDNKILKNIEKQGYINQTQYDVENYAITAKGVYFHECLNNILNEYMLIDFIDNKWFDFVDSRKPLSEKEKVILFSMITTRAFSQNSAIDLKMSDLVLDNWKEILEESFNFLSHYGIVTKVKSSDLFNLNVNERIISHLIRHTDLIPKKTKGIYVAFGKQKYYLNVSDTGVINEDKLVYLLRLIFNEIQNFTIINEIIKFCKNISYSKAFMVFDLHQHIFNSPKYDDIIEKVIRETLFG